MNKVLEVARTGKLIGSSLEAKVYLHTSDASLASRLHEMCTASNDADALHRIFITSQVCSFPFFQFTVTVTRVVLFIYPQLWLLLNCFRVAREEYPVSYM